MSDFFGGILDSIRSAGDDVAGFFDSAIGEAIGKGVIGLTKNTEKKGAPRLNEGFIEGTDRSFAARQRPDDLRSEDYSSAEIEWLKRLHRFASLDTGTDVRLGGK